MKHIILLLVVMASAGLCHGQKNVERPLTPARGHYKQLSAFSRAGKPGQEKIDALKFETEAETITARMSRKPHYLQDVTLNDFDIPMVPANSSDMTRAEINYLLTLQKYRTPEQIRASIFMADVYYSLSVKPGDSTYNRFRNNLFHIGHSIGTWFNPESLPLTAELVANTWRDASYFIWSMKFKYARIRPYVIETQLKNIQETDWAAYPSGHASNSYVNAYLFCEFAPEFTDVFMKDAYDMAHSREILGVHYPSDSETGRIFARQLVNKLLQNPQFRKDLEAARKEWAIAAKESFKNPVDVAPGK
jgi:acid phosphatase (class A)